MTCIWEGIETSYQYFLDFLPDPFKGLGFQANYTYIKGETENPLTSEKDPIAQVSKDNYNLILIYDKGPFNGRLAYNGPVATSTVSTKAEFSRRPSGSSRAASWISRRATRPPRG